MRAGVLIMFLAEGKENNIMEIDSIVLDYGKEYFIVDNVEVDNICYTLFADTQDEKEIRIRKISLIDNKQYYVGLDDEDEFKKVIMAFDKKINS